MAKVKHQTHQINSYGVSQEQWKSKKDPRQVWSLEVEEPKKVHADVRISSTPDIDEHDGEWVSQEDKIHKQCHNLCKCH